MTAIHPYFPGLAATVLLPIVPAYLLFRAAKSQALVGSSDDHRAHDHQKPSKERAAVGEHDPDPQHERDEVPVNHGGEIADDAPAPTMASHARVSGSGPLASIPKWIRFDLGGAFAGYFLLFIPLYYNLPDPPKGNDTIQNYTFVGKIQLAVDSLADPDRWKDFVRFSLEPPAHKHDVYSNGTFTLKFPYDPTNQWEAPVISIDTDYCGSEDISLIDGQAENMMGFNNYPLRFDHERRRIVAQQPIVLYAGAPGSEKHTRARQLCGGQ
jgi:hypothetical protein